MTIMFILIGAAAVLTLGLPLLATILLCLFDKEPMPHTRWEDRHKPWSAK